MSGGGGGGGGLGGDGALWRWEAGAIARAVRAGEVSAVEVVDRHLERIAEANPEVNAVTRVLADAAREQAARIDSRRAVGVDPGPLAGVPFTVKENIAIGGVPTTHGARWFRDATATADAPPVARLRAAGAIPVGRGNMPTLTLAGMHSRSELFGDTVNPWDPRVTPGGSSGGDGAAVAAGLAPLGLGNDSGGSVRIPAAFCGVTGLKPTEGRFPADHRIGAEDPPLSAQTFPVDGPLARTAGDLRLAFEALAGPGADPRDPRAVPVPTEGPDGVGPVRVAVVADPGGRGVHPWVREAVDTAASYLSDAGYAVTEVPDVPMHDEALEAYGRMIMTEFALTWPSVKRILGEGGHRYIEMSMARTAPVGLSEYLRLTGVRLTVRRAWAEFLTEYPLLLGPVFTSPPPAPGLESRDEEGHRAVTEAMRLCTVTSFAGVPAVAVPAGVWGGLPQGVQIVGQAFREDRCLAAAAVVERGVGRLTPVGPHL
ncbi:amidase [Streptomyces macrosporus]|uniref:Amidase family protein n=1 Tax=Streptomyces macrosporus TaxID=44032 RepID=A0ABN3K6R2_9ACTN